MPPGNSPTSVQTISSSLADLASFSPPASCFEVVASIGHGVWALAGGASSCEVVASPYDVDNINQIDRVFTFSDQNGCYPRHHVLPIASDYNKVPFPTTACPPQYYTAATSQLAKSGGATQVDCCPEGFKKDSIYCVKTAPMTISTTIECSPSDDGKGPGSHHVTTMITPASTVIDVTTDTIIAPPFRIHYDGADLVQSAMLIPTASTQQTAASSAVPASTIETQATSTEAPQTEDTQQSSSNSGLTTGSKIAIGIVIPLLIIALTLLALFLLRRRRRNQASRQASKTLSPTSASEDENPQFAVAPWMEREVNGQYPSVRASTPPVIATNIARTYASQIARTSQPSTMSYTSDRASLAASSSPAAAKVKCEGALGELRKERERLLRGRGDLESIVKIRQEEARVEEEIRKLHEGG